MTNEDTCRILSLALRILEQYPEWLRPESDMRDMRRILAGKDSGRDGLIIAEAAATVLVIYAAHPLEGVNKDEWIARDFNTRMHDLSAAFELLQRLSTRNVAVSYLGACTRLYHANHKQAPSEA